MESKNTNYFLNKNQENNMRKQLVFSTLFKIRGKKHFLTKFIFKLVLLLNISFLLYLKTKAFDFVKRIQALLNFAKSKNNKK